LVEQFKGLGGLGDLLLAHAFEGDALRARGHGTLPEWKPRDQAYGRIRCDTT
jgi:hypothetical protein